MAALDSTIKPIWLCSYTCYLVDERMEKLYLLGFQWVIRDPKKRSLLWNENFQELQSYQAEHGNFNVPLLSGKIGCCVTDHGCSYSWVNSQRTMNRWLIDGKTSPMTDEPMQKLEPIGFQWSIRQPRNKSDMQPPSTTRDSPLMAKAGRCIRLFLNYVHCLFVHQFFNLSHVSLRHFSACAQFTTITTDYAYCKNPKEFPTDSQMDDQEDACGVLLDEPTVE